MERFAKLAIEALNQVLPQPIQAHELEIPPDPKMGDFGFPCFKLAKTYRKSPQQVAQDLAGQLNALKNLPPELQVTTTGPYVNFLIPPARALAALLEDILAGPELGHYGSTSEKRGTWVLEYSSPNVAKPLNIYHLRPTALGAALDRIGRFRGFRVISINHLGDWGKQYGMLTVAFERYGKSPDQMTMHELVALYVKINADADKDPTIGEQARQAFLKLEQGDPKVTAIWQKCAEISLIEFHKNYKRLGVKFDHIWGESYYKEQLTPLLDDLKNRGLLVQSEGAWVVPVTDAAGKELPPCILQKSDGATLYATRDVAAAIYRYGQFKFDRMTYVTGNEQRLHFQQVFAVLKQMGLKWVDCCEHITHGLYRFKDAKMSTRKGNFITLEEVLELAKDRVKELMRERAKASHSGPGAGTTLSEAEFEETAEAVAVGAVVFFDLHTDPVRDVEFDLDRVVDFEGETGPYLQYAHTRCLSILRKAQESGQLGSATSPNGLVNFQRSGVDLLKHETEVSLIKLLGQFPIHLERSLSFAKASQLAHYLIDITRAFGAFYRECQVLGNSPELTQARLMLVEATRRILARGMTLLGIPQPKKM